MSEGFTLIKNEIFDENLSIQEQSLLIAIIRYNNQEKGYAYPSYSQLKKISKISDTRTLNKNMNNLLKKGFLKKETVKGVGCKYYLMECINTPSVESHLVENSTTCKDTLPPSVELHHDLVENYTTTNTNTNINTNTIIYSPETKEFALSFLLQELILKNDKNSKANKANLLNWSKYIDQIIRIDKRDPSEIKNVILWSQQDNFWKTNILSTKSLRKHFDKLVLQMNRTNNTGDKYKMKEGEKNGINGKSAEDELKELGIGIY